MKEEICKITEDKPCPDDCDMKDLKWDQDAIVARIKEEQQNVKDLKKKGMFKNKHAIKDKIMGIYILEKVLKNKFEYTPVHVVDEEFEKSASFINKAFSRFKKRK